MAGGIAADAHRRLTLILDRAREPRLVQHLHRRRLRESRWPNPGVYSIPDLALRLVRHFEQLTQERLLPWQAWTDFDRLAFLIARDGKNTRPQERLQALQELRLLPALGLSTDDWKSLLETLGEEGRGQGEAEELSGRIIEFLHMRSHALQHERLDSPWSAVESALRIFSSRESARLNWYRITERDLSTRLPGGLRFEVVSAGREAFPLETRFLKALRAHFLEHAFPHAFIETAPAEESGGDLKSHLENLPELSTEDLSEDVGLYAVEELRPVEASLLVPDLLPELRLEPAPARPARALARAFRLWAHYSSQGKDPAHPFLRGNQHRALLEAENFDCDTPPTVFSLIEFLSRHSPRAGELDPLLGLGPEALKEQPLLPWVDLLAEENFFDFDLKSAPPLFEGRLSPRGTELLSLEALPAGQHALKLLWGRREDLLDRCDPEKASGRRPFPSLLVRSLESLGFIVPDPRRETENLRQALLREKNLRLLRRAELGPRPLHAAPPAPFKLEPLPTRLSASAIEAYHQCPFQYYAGRVLRLEEEEPWDPQRLSPLARGRWLHKALELFFKAENPPWDAAETFLETTLQEHLEAFFGQRATPSYREILKAQAQVFASQLALYLKRLEEPLEKALGRRRFLTEMRLETRVEEFAIVGSIDRIDVLPQGHLLLWDYKSGAVPSSTRPETQIRGGKLQWFLYRQWLEALSEEERLRLGLPRSGKILGGGYINPLLPEKASLFVFPELDPVAAEQLTEVWTTAGGRLSPLFSQEETQLSAALAEALDQVFSGLREGDISARPRSDADCRTCHHQVICGRPQLVEEGFV